MKTSDLEKMRDALILLQAYPPTIREVVRAGDKAINAAGLNPYCMHEGANGNDTIDLWWLPPLLTRIERKLNP